MGEGKGRKASEVTRLVECPPVTHICPRMRCEA